MFHKEIRRVLTFNIRCEKKCFVEISGFSIANVPLLNIQRNSFLMRELFKEHTLFLTEFSKRHFYIILFFMFKYLLQKEFMGLMAAQLLAGGRFWI